MKSYEEVSDNLLKRRDSFLLNKKKKEKAILGALFSLCGVFLVAFLGFGAWSDGTLKNLRYNAVESESEVSTDKKVYESFAEADGNSEFYENNSKTELSDFGSAPESKVQTGITGDTIGVVIVGDKTYTQFNTFANLDELSKFYTPDVFLGDASKYEGTYKECINDIWAMLYTSKEDSNVLIVMLENGAYVVLKN